MVSATVVEHCEMIANEQSAEANDGSQHKHKPEEKMKDTAVRYWQTKANMAVLRDLIVICISPD